MNKMTDLEKKEYIRKHLSHELRSLLGAATVWQRLKVENQGFDVCVAMDSAFVHCRSLFNFFCKKNKKKKQSGRDYSVTEFKVDSPYLSNIFDQWIGELNWSVMHLHNGRTNTSSKNSIQDQVEIFALEILRLWKLFEVEESASIFSEVLYDARKEAIKCAKDDTKEKINPLFTL